MMKLYCSSNSPYARKVRVVSAEIEVFDRIEFIDTNPRDPETGLWSLNPLGKIPTLVLDDGDVLYDSPVICEYLDAEFGGNRLLGDRGKVWRIRTLTALADGIMDAGMAARLETLRPEDEQSPAWIEKQLATVERGFGKLSEAVSDLDDSVSHASIAAACAIFWIGFRHPHKNWLKNSPELEEWHTRFCTRSSMKRTEPEAGL